MNRDEAYQGIYMKDVWGETTGVGDPRGTHVKIDNGMLVARGLPYKENSPEAKDVYKNSLAPALPQRCPITNDLLAYKSVSVVCKVEDQQAVEYWLEYVHGGGCIEGTAELPDGKILIRSNYMCW